MAFPHNKTTFTAPATRCVYLPDRVARQEYELAHSLSPQAYEERMNLGWRKFGHVLFHPVCTGCQECRPIRICAGTFQPDRSQRRSLQRNADLAVQCAPPCVDAARLTLYNHYHVAQAVRKGWPVKHLSAGEYHAQFVINPLPAVEISLWDEDRLRAVALTDVTPNTISGVYHYHDPDCLDRGLGTLVMLETIALARRLGKEYAYFGYYVAGCASMAYKARFRPCELLGADGIWRASV